MRETAATVRLSTRETSATVRFSTKKAVATASLFTRERGHYWVFHGRGRGYC
jgi:hypothetical protein